MKKKKKTKIEYNCKSSLLDRFKAFVTDTFMLLMPVMYGVIYLVLGSREGFRDNMGFGWFLIISTHLVITVAFWYLKSQTPGLKAYELKLVNKTHQKPTIFQLIIRYFATLFNFVFLVTFLVPFMNKDRLTFQDLVSKTCIINE